MFIFDDNFFSCQKNIENKFSSSLTGLSDKLQPVIKCDSIWQGSYIFPGQTSSTTVSADSMIKNGIAQIPPALISSFGYYTSIALGIPVCESINGDNLKFEASVENPDSLLYADADYDVTLFIYGSEDTAHVTFIAYRSQYTSMQVGTFGISGDPSLLYLFEGWTKVTLVTKNNQFVVSINGKPIKAISYKGTRIGELKGIAFGFKGSGKIDQVKLSNSKTATVYLNDNFIDKNAVFK